jgi:hypothetical protein
MTGSGRGLFKRSTGGAKENDDENQLAQPVSERRTKLGTSPNTNESLTMSFAILGIRQNLTSMTKNKNKYA